MKCPDCDGKLEKTSVVGVDNSMRCEKCGGVWAMAWVINKIAEDGELKIKPTGKPQVGNESGGRMPMCPVDNLVMAGQSGEELPPEVPVWKCGKCGWWWMPGDSVFELKAAFDAKREFAKRWKKPSPFKTFVLPVILTLFLFVGLAIGSQAVKERSMVGTKAMEIQQLTVRYKEGGRAEVRFMVKVEVGTIVYRLPDELQWRMVSVVKQGEMSVAEINDVSPGDMVWLSIGDEVRQVAVGERE